MKAMVPGTITLLLIAHAHCARRKLHNGDIAYKEHSTWYQQVQTAIRVNLAGAAFGSWGPMSQCPNGKLATSVKQKVEADQGGGWNGGDDTALNAVKLKCQDGTEITSTEGAYGNWGGYADCPSGSYIVGFRLKSESDQGGGDDTTANAISVKCSGGSLLSLPGDAPWGKWSNYATCPEGQAVCGIKTRVEAAQGGGDDTALGDVELSCCQVGASAPAFALANDKDGDTLDDDFEMTCAQKFKPVVYLAQGEEFGPSTVENYLSTCVLRKYGSCGHSLVETEVTASLNTTALPTCTSAAAITARYGTCWPPLTDPDSTLGSPTPSTLASVASANCGGNGECYIRCLDCQSEGKCDNLGRDQPAAKGTHGAALTQTPFYVHVFPDTDNTVQIQYWFFYNFNGPTDGFGYHQGDWEHFSVRTDASCSKRMGYIPFAHGTPPPWSNAPIAEEDGHPVIYSAVNSHATYLTVGSHQGGTSFTQDHCSKGDRWFPDVLINPGEKTGSGRQPMTDDSKWVDFTDVWGSDSGFDGSLSNSLCDSGPHLQWDQMMP